MRVVNWEPGQIVSAEDLNSGVFEWGQHLTNPPRFMATDIQNDSIKANGTTGLAFKNASQYGGWTSVKKGGHRSFRVPETGHYLICYHICFRKPGAQTYGLLEARIRHTGNMDGSGGTVIHDTFSSTKRNGRQSQSGMVIYRLEKGYYVAIEADTPRSTTSWINGSKDKTGAIDRTGEAGGFISAVLLDRS